MPRSGKRGYFNRLKDDIRSSFNDDRKDLLDQFRAYAGPEDVSDEIALLSQRKLSLSDIKIVHYGRQKLLDGQITSVADLIESGDYERRKDSENAFHRIGDGNGGNIKFTSSNGMQEWVVQNTPASGWRIVNEPLNEGTYNFVATGFGHLNLDVDPWIFWGNAADDPSTRSDRRALFDNASLPLPLGANFGRAIKGDGKDNILTGTDRDEKMVGRGGNDTLMGGAGADKILGGPGTDTVSYVSSSSGVGLNLATGKGYLGDAARQSKSETIKGIENVIGSDHDDIVIGDGKDNDLSGLGGRDVLNGARGNDTLVGGAGSDELQGGKGRDVLIGGADDDRLDGGQGLDVAIYSGALSDYVLTRNGADLEVRGTLSRTGTDQLHDVEWLRFADEWVRSSDLATTTPPPFTGVSDSVRINGTYTDHILIDDVNGDGVADIASSYDNGIYTIRGIHFHSGASGARLDALSFSLGENNGAISDLALYDDVDGDGVDEILIAAEDYGGRPFSSGGGAFLIYSVTKGQVLGSYLNGSSLFQNYGTQIVSIGDADADGVDDFLVGDGGRTFYGTVHAISGKTLGDIYETDGGAGWAQTGFGTHVEAVQDIDGDGVDDFMASISNGILSQPEIGVFSGADGELIHSYSGQDYGRDFGGRFGGVGDIDGDGTGDFAISRSTSTSDPEVDLWTTVFSGRSGAEILTISGDADVGAVDTIGVGDITGDGLSDLIIAANGYFGTPDTLTLVSRNSLGAWETEEILRDDDGFTLFDLGLAQGGQVSKFALSRSDNTGNYVEVFDVGVAQVLTAPQALISATDDLL